MKYTLLLVLLLLLLGSCGSSTDGPGTEATAGPRISLSYWEYWDPSLDDLLDEIFFEFAEESGIHLERNHYEPTQLRDGFIQEAVIGGGPDFIILPSDHLGSISLSRSALPADEAFPAEFFQAFSSQSLEHVTLDGKVWGVPILTGNSLILFYNRTLVPTPPANWDELILMAREQTTENTWGLTYNLSSPFYFAPFLAAFGGSFFEPGTANPSLDSPAMAQALEFVHDLKFRHEILSPMTDSPSANRFFAEGRAAFLINGPWAINQFVDAVDFALMPLPPIGDRIPRPLIASGTLVLNQNLQGQPEKLEAVEEVIRFLTNVETQVHSLPGRFPP